MSCKKLFFIPLFMVLAACTSAKDKDIAYFQAHPEAMQPAAIVLGL